MSEPGSLGNPRVSYIRNDDGNPTHHTYDQNDGTRCYVHEYEPGLLGLGPDTGELITVIDKYEDGTSLSFDVGDEPRRW